MAAPTGSPGPPRRSSIDGATSCGAPPQVTGVETGEDFDREGLARMLARSNTFLAELGRWHSTRPSRCERPADIVPQPADAGCPARRQGVGRPWRWVAVPGGTTAASAGPAGTRSAPSGATTRHQVNPDLPTSHEITGPSDLAPEDVAGSLSLRGAVSLGTGVMIGAGVFALTGQAAALAGDLFPIAFLGAAVVAGFSAYSYVKLSNAYPSSGGVAMFLRREYGLGTATGVFALFMYFSMVINESLVARTFGAYVVQPLDIGPSSFWVPALGVALLVVAFAINVAGNRVIQASEGVMAVVKIAGLGIFAVVGLWFVSATNFTNGADAAGSAGSIDGFLAAVAISILAYKGFTTITNSGGEIVDPHRNTGRAIVISIAICSALYVALSVAVAGNLTLSEIIAAQDYALARAAEPALGTIGLWATVAIAVIATASGVIASIFAASRMLAMLTRMKEVPHSHLGMPGTVRLHTMVYTVAFAMVLTILFDLRRIAALGAIFYLLMDIAIQWGVLSRLRSQIEARPAIVATAIVLDVVILGAFLWVKASADPLILYVSAAAIVVIVIGERLFMRSHTDRAGNMDM